MQTRVLDSWQESEDLVVAAAVRTAIRPPSSPTATWPKPAEYYKYCASGVLPWHSIRSARPERGPRSPACYQISTVTTC